jgi:hypothetical protein
LNEHADLDGYELPPSDDENKIIKDTTNTYKNNIPQETYF